jgi:hypothetical protein
MPRGSFTWPKAATFNSALVDLPPSTIESVSQSLEQAAPGVPLWEAMRPSLVTLAGGAPAQREEGEAAGGEPSRTESALELARPFLQLVQGGLAPTDKSSEGVRFYEQAQPVVAAAPSSEAATKMVEAVRYAPVSSPADDRITLSDLTLISVASATNQIAASPTGASPTAPSSGGGGHEGGAHGGGGKAGGPGSPPIEELARRVYDELQRVIEIQRERSGDPWE